MYDNNEVSAALVSVSELGVKNTLKKVVLLVTAAILSVLHRTPTHMHAQSHLLQAAI